MFSGWGEKLLERNKCPGHNMRQYGICITRHKQTTVRTVLKQNYCANHVEVLYRVSQVVVFNQMVISQLRCRRILCKTEYKTEK